LTQKKILEFQRKLTYFSIISKQVTNTDILNQIGLLTNYFCHAHLNSFEICLLYWIFSTC